LRPIQYEGIEVETCDGCGGEWLDAGELGAIVRLREVKFTEDQRRAISESTAITGVKLEEVDRDLVCPKCGGTTDALNYGGDTGIILDRCTVCRGLWLDGTELEKIQMLVEGWNDQLPADLEKYGPMLHDTAARLDRDDDVQASRIPLVGRYINALVNRILDVTG
jgi:Zn-finger nucleic acid-binding protein